jgi:superfamily II DNA or RNA helicase
MGYEFRPYQNDALKAVEDARNREVTRQLVVMATGLGKTVFVAGLLKAMGMPKTFGFMHREELIEQAGSTILSMNPAASLGIEKAERHGDIVNDRVILASVATVGKRDRRRLSGIPRDWPGVIWIDEAHHAPAQGYLETLDYFGVYGEKPRRDVLLLGTTATPDRLDEMGYDRIFDDVVYRYGLRDAISDGWLADVRAWRIETDIDLGNVKKRGGDYQQIDLARAIDESQITETAVQTWRDKCRGMRSLFFAVTKAHASKLGAMLKAAGARVAVITDDTPRDERKYALQLFRDGELDAVVNVLVLTEGFDAPDTECVHILRPTTSRALYSQMLGRGTRKTERKAHVEIFDYTGASHDVCSCGQIFGLPDSWTMEGQSVVEDADKVDQVESELGLKAEGSASIKDLFAKVKEHRVDLIMGTITDSGLPSTLAWLRPSQAKEKWVLGWRNETKDRVERIPGSYRESAREAIAAKNLWGVYERIEVFRNELGLYEAQLKRSGPEGSNTQSGKIESDRSLVKLVQRLEKMITDRRPHKVRLLKKDAKWRRDPCTQAQRKILAGKGVPEWFLPQLNKGDAGTLINMPGATVRKWFEEAPRQG